MHVVAHPCVGIDCEKHQRKPFARIPLDTVRSGAIEQDHAITRSERGRRAPRFGLEFFEGLVAIILPVIVEAAAREGAKATCQARPVVIAIPMDSGAVPAVDQNDL